MKIETEKEKEIELWVTPDILVHGDCLKIMPYIQDASIDLILSDPPYGMTACKWDNRIPLEPMWKQLKRIIKPSGVIALTASQPFTSILGSSNIEWLRYSWVWQKTRATGYLLAKHRPMKNHEDILIFYTMQPTYNPQGLKDFNKMARRGLYENCYNKSGTSNFQAKTNYPRTIQKFKNEGKFMIVAQKPLALMEYLVKTYTNKTDTVLDFVMGSGTVGVACKNLERKFIGIEIDKDIFEIAKQRIKKGQG